MSDSIVCRHIRVSGVVQGVGFRPFVWRLARELGLAGWVRNDSRGVEIEVCGAAGQVRTLLERLEHDAPPLARVNAVVARDASSVCAGEGFVIIDSRNGRAGTMIGHDTAVCRDCLGELFDPGGRRWRHPFINCTNCGPRYTISRGLPYDRVRTSLKPFPMCSRCHHEYRRPEDRRFHAEANCCPKCGPQLLLLDGEGHRIGGDPIAATLDLLRQGKIVAIKGLGGFHLACDAHDAVAVALLRERKQREEKPFVVMLANAASAARYVQIGIGEPGLLSLPTRPAILLRKRSQCDAALAGVAPGLAWLGVMLPYTPVQFLLFHEAARRPAGTGWLERAQDLALVMTSANPGGEPLVIGNSEALLRLYGIADAFLMHDRDIVARCDDSVARISSTGLQFIRRARGYTPRSIRLPASGPSVLAVGGWYKNTVCVTRGDEAFVSQHIGDLDNAAACDFLEETVGQLVKLLGVEPTIVAHDLHPDFHSTRFAADFAEQRGLPLLGVQHHHAHAAAVLAEHGIRERALALSLDGVGLGTDGSAWGGELLRIDGANFTRLGHLAPLGLPGGDRAANEPWRMAAAMLHRLGQTTEIRQRFPDQPAAAAVAQMLAGDIHCPPTTSAGRIFDAAAGLLGVREVMAYEGQAAMLLEGLAQRYGDILPLDHGWKIDGGVLDLLPLFAVLADERSAERGAALFHATLAAAIADWLRVVAPDEKAVVASGGCFLNQMLLRGLRARLGAQGIQVIESHQVPPNDGGLSVGQAWVALQHLLDG
ncbi:carbamoyltransferase HypF [Accumulibacter sp.]|uniref:carbamoyltransferase HypF n=1 Tax=Accumulibacter sp. TaxID=2053492 RepID=UPI0025CC48A6|nr:carbamoyltransferase HypF [Accumulibacter sp.]MCM8595535.1 carbamoyltransferase HypF [Accumulibacter sp.]MCM8627293.1 carbamoyltransferase HypF [Accumulibacter sp.]MDS4049682.1 carbamoyltransferase HypF [Accumulibacter sp.]